MKKKGRKSKKKKEKKIVKKKDKKVIKQIKSNVEVRVIKDEKHLNGKIFQQGNNEFNEFIQSSPQISSPALDKIANAPEPINLEENLTQDTSSQDTEKQFDYSANISQSDYSTGTNATEKLSKYQSNMAPPILRPLSEFQDDPRVQFLDPLAGMRTNSEESMQERMIETRIRGAETQTGLPFEDEKRKYKEIRF